MGNPPQAPTIETRQDNTLTISYAKREIVMHYISEGELEAISSAGSGSVNVAFFGISFGALIAFGITLATVPITSPLLQGTFVGLTAVSLIASAYFGIMAYLDKRAATQKLKALRGMK